MSIEYSTKTTEDLNAARTLPVSLRVHAEVQNPPNRENEGNNRMVRTVYSSTDNTIPFLPQMEE